MPCVTFIIQFKKIIKKHMDSNKDFSFDYFIKSLSVHTLSELCQINNHHSYNLDFYINFFDTNHHI